MNADRARRQLKKISEQLGPDFIPYWLIDEGHARPVGLIEHVGQGVHQMRCAHHTEALGAKEPLFTLPL